MQHRVLRHRGSVRAREHRRGRGGCSQDGLLERGECFLLLKAPNGTRMASKRWQRHWESAQNARVECEQSDAWFSFTTETPAGTCRCHGDDFMAEGSDVLMDRLDRVMKDEFNAKMLQLTGVKFLSGHCAGMSKRCASVGAEAHDRSRSSLCCLDLQTLEL